MSPMSPLVDASIASALISPDPVSYITIKNEEEKADEKAGKNNQKEPSLRSGSKSSDEKPKSVASKKQPQEVLVTADERFYAVDSEFLEKLRIDKPWAKVESSSSSQGGAASLSSSGQQQQGSTAGTSRPRPVAKFFETLSLSPSAVTKMMMHCQSGVEKGISKGGNPIEGE
jgi:hypothetical protein